MPRNLYTKPQGKTLNMFWLELMHTELKKQLTWILNSSSSQQSLVIPYHPVYSSQQAAAGAAFQSCLLWLQLTQGTGQELCWAGERCLPTLPSRDWHSSTPDTAGKDAEQKWWVWKPVLESQHSFGCVIQDAQAGLSLGSTNGISVHGA